MSARARRNLLLLLLGVQVAILVAQHETFFSELFRFPSRLADGMPARGGSSLPLLAAVIGASALWARRVRTAERFAAAGLATVAAAGLAVYAAALATGSLFAWLAWAAVAISAALALASPRSGALPPTGPPRAPWTAFDAGSALFLSTLLVPAVFPYIAYDAKMIWAWRAYAMRDDGFARAVTGVIRPEYPPLDSILLWLGVGDPLFEGRLLPWLLLVFFALLFRARVARISPSLAAPALLFLVSTVHVWQGIGRYYADVPLMIFAVAGWLLALGLPGDAAPSRFDLVAGGLLLASAILVRPDGALAVALVGVGAACRVGGAARRAWPAAAAAAVAWATWALRPGWLRPGPDAYVFFSRGGEWREAGATTAAAVQATLLTYLNAMQGQWLSHKGLGVTFWIVLLVAVSRARTPVSDDAREAETRLYGTVSFLSFAGVAVLYLVIPFRSDIRGAVAPDEFPTWVLAFRNFARVGMGRMVVHLVPYCVLYVVSAYASAGTPGRTDGPAAP